MRRSLLFPTLLSIAACGAVAFFLISESAAPLRVGLLDKLGDALDAFNKKDRSAINS